MLDTSCRDMRNLFTSKLKNYSTSILKYLHYCPSLKKHANTLDLATALTESANSNSLLHGKQIHGQIIKLDLITDIFSQNNLINMYIKCGGFNNGIKLFEEMPDRNLVSWTLIISGAVKNGEYKVGVEVFKDMIRNGLRPNEFGLSGVIKLCSSNSEWYGEEFGFCVHCFVLKIGFEKNPFVCSSILNMYAMFGDIGGAEMVFFECMDYLDVGCWNSMIGGYAQCGFGYEAVCILSLMMRCLGVCMDKFTFINALKGCSMIGDLNFGREIHGLMIRSQVDHSTSIMNALVDMYIKNGRRDYAMKVFDMIRNKDVISWNSLFSSFSKDDDATKITKLFHEFMLTGLKPNLITFSVLFRQCGRALELSLGHQLCCLAIQLGCFGKANIASSVIVMFSRCGYEDVARLVFDSVPLKNIVLWNEMINGYSLHGCNEQALQTFCELRQLGYEANEYTFSSILDISSRMENPQIITGIHSTLIKSGFIFHKYVNSSLIKAYISLGLIDDSFKFLMDAKRFDLTSWGSMISALVNQRYNHEAMKVLICLVKDGEKPDEFVLGSILNGCACVSAHYQTCSVHSLVMKTGFQTQPVVASALIDAYAKCGDIVSANFVFEESAIYGDIVLFNTMMMAYAHHGLVEEAMVIFQHSKLANLQPSLATFVSVISACNHLGLVNQGLNLFKVINFDYGMEPSPDIYGCLVDMLSRNGFLEDARHIIRMMPFSPWPAIWRSFLSGCRIHNNMELGEWAAKELLKLRPENGTAYLLLKKIYSEGGCWKRAEEVSKGMIEKGVQKDQACSWIEI